MENNNIIEKITEPTDFVSNIVIVRKPNGNIGVCLDPSNLNKYIKREHFKLPTFEEVAAKMAGSKIFSKLDASTAFFHIKLSENSTKLCTFTTPFGRYCFKRLPYGLSSAPEVFHRQYSEIFQNIAGCEVFVDDVIIYAKNQMDHDKILENVLDVAKQNGIQFNLAKCQFGITEVIYLGHILSSEGIKPDQKKVESILNLEKPKNVKEVQRLLGMITYVSKFIPAMSQVCNPLRELIKKGKEWKWTGEHDGAFNELKDILMSQPVLQFYDPNKPCKISVDASKDALGAVLLQNNLPVAYASKALTSTQKAYAQIEKEMLAIVFGCIRFHQFVYGMTVEIESDHKPLETIFKKPLSEIPLRLQRMRLQIQKYDINVRYKPGKTLLLADSLSRDVKNKTDDNSIIEELYESQVCLVKCNLSISEHKYKIFKEETNKDEELRMLKQYIQEGWPKNINNIPVNLKLYYTYRGEMYLYDGLIFKNNCIVVPKSLRQDILYRIHYNHIGVEKCKNRARQCVYWPNMSKDIENKVLSCGTCERFKNNNCKEPMIIREMPDIPWSILGTDVFHYKDKNYLIVVDYFSKYFEVIQLNNLTPECTIDALKSVFSRHGIPDKLYSDNGTNYSSYKFKNFSRDWNFIHMTSSPLHAQSNGLAERYIQTVKNIFKKADYESKDKYLALLEYRVTPISNLDYKTPAELLMGRKIQGLLPNINNSCKNKYIQSKLYENSNKQKQYYDKNVKKMKDLIEGQKVIVTTGNRKPLVYAEVLTKCERPNSYKLLTENGTVIDRNRKHLIESKNDKKMIVKKEKEADDEDDLKMYNENMLDITSNDNTCADVNETTIEQETVKNSNCYSRSGRELKKPSYLNDYV